MEVIVLNITNIIGAFASIVGLIYTIIAYLKIKQVKKILRKRISDKIMIQNIEVIMKYPENVPLSRGNKQNLKNVIRLIEDLIKEDKSGHKTEWNQLQGIKKVLKTQTFDMVNIKQSLKNIKQLFTIREEA
jgi:hypothetical protein